MKTLVNKANPAIRITAPEITQWVESAYVVGRHLSETEDVRDIALVIPKKDWTLVEEEPEFEHRRKDTIYFLETAKTHYADTSELEKCIEWLKGLQPTEGIKGNLEEIPSNVDLEKEIENKRRTMLLNLFGPMNGEQGLAIRNFARHFYELGLKVRKVPTISTTNVPEEIKPEAFKASMGKIWDFLKRFKGYKEQKNK